MEVKHKRQITDEEATSPEAEINKQEWNEGHTITGHDKELHDTLNIDADTVDGQHYNKTATEPSNPQIGDLWFDTTNQAIKVRVTV